MSLKRHQETRNRDHSVKGVIYIRKPPHHSKERELDCIKKLAALEIYCKHGRRDCRVPHTGSSEGLLIQLNAKKFTNHFKATSLLIGKKAPGKRNDLMLTKGSCVRDHQEKDYSPKWSVPGTKN